MNLQESIRRILRENWKDTKWVNDDYTITISDVLDYIGDKTYDVIEFTLNILKILSDTLAPNQIYPEGTPIPDASTQALTSTISEAIETVKNKILVNIKSNKVKVE